MLVHGRKLINSKVRGGIHKVHSGITSSESVRKYPIKQVLINDIE